MVSQKPLVNPLNTSNLYITQINTRNGGVLSQNKQSVRHSSVGTCTTHSIGTTGHTTPVSTHQKTTSILKSKSINKDNKQMRWWLRCCLDHSPKQSTRRTGRQRVIINNKHHVPEMATVLTVQPLYDLKCNHSPCSELKGQPGSRWWWGGQPTEAKAAKKKGRAWTLTSLPWKQKWLRRWPVLVKKKRHLSSRQLSSYLFDNLTTL